MFLVCKLDTRFYIVLFLLAMQDNMAVKLTVNVVFKMLLVVSTSVPAYIPEGATPSCEVHIEC